MLQVLPYVDILFGNETEAAAFAEANNFGVISDDISHAHIFVSAI